MQIRRTRTVGAGENARHEVVLDKTPFYAESGGQIGDTGVLEVGDETIEVLDTQRLDDGTVAHVVRRLPEDPAQPVTARVTSPRREQIKKHHSATHLLHAALREVLGEHVQQKGSLVAPDRLRFDFSHFERVTPEEQRVIERRVNEWVLQECPRERRGRRAHRGGEGAWGDGALRREVRRHRPRRHLRPGRLGRAVRRHARQGHRRDRAVPDHERGERRQRRPAARGGRRRGRAGLRGPRARVARCGAGAVQGAPKAGRGSRRRGDGGAEGAGEGGRRR